MIRRLYSFFVGVAGIIILTGFFGFWLNEWSYLSYYTAVGAIALNIGVVLVFWGWLWFLWDHNATAPGYLLTSAIILLLIGVFLT